MFIKSIELDEEKRIIIEGQSHLAEYLKDQETRKMLKGAAENVLGEDFKQLEIGKCNCRITVTPENAENCIKLVEEELVKGIEMALAFMSQMNSSKDEA
jgi:RNase P/RNase MRP subunit POP5